MIPPSHNEPGTLFIDPNTGEEYRLDTASTSEKLQ